MKKSCLLLLTVFTLAGCSDKDGGPEPTGKSVWERPHAEYMLLDGKVASVTEEVVEEVDPTEEPLLFTVLQAEFNPTGQLTFYNPILGYDPRNPEPENAVSIARQARFGDWGVASKAWAYAYDAQGRMRVVTEYELGEAGTKEYQLDYGDHELYVPAPFGVMDKPLWLLRGVTSVRGPKDFSLTCDARTVTTDYTHPHFGTTHEVYTYTGNYPSRCVAQTTTDGATTTVTTDYTWSSDGRLLRMTTDDSASGQVTSTEYSARMPYGPVTQGLTTDGVLNWKVAWDYHTDGEVASVRFVEGRNWVIQPYTRSYSTPDTHGNWLRSEKNSDGEISRYTRTITYR